MKNRIHVGACSMFAAGLAIIGLAGAPALVQAANPFGFDFTVEPNPAPPGSPITITVETTEPSCVPLPETRTLYLEGNIAYFGLPGSDGCEDIPPTTRTYVSPPLPSGKYTINFYQCSGIDDDGNDACMTLEEIPFSVLYAPGTFSHKIPAMSIAGMGVLVAASLLAGLGAWRRAR